jgi:hypothetical protein
MGGEFRESLWHTFDVAPRFHKDSRRFQRQAWNTSDVATMTERLEDRTLLAATVAAGDVAIVAFDSDGDDFAILPLRDIPGNSVLFFTDEGWSTALNDFDSNAFDSHVRWTVGATAIDAGTVLSFSDLSTHGTVVGTLNLSTSGDQLIIYQTSDDNAETLPPTFIYALNNNKSSAVNGWQDDPDNVSSVSSHVPNGLTRVTVNGGAGEAFGLLNESKDNHQYDGPTGDTDKATWLSRFHTTGNWTSSNSTLTPTAAEFGNPDIGIPATVVVTDAGGGGGGLTIETEVDVVGGNLVVTDSNGGNTADNLTFTADGTNLTITDNNGDGIDLLNTLNGGTGDGTTAVTILLSAFTGTLDINTLGGADTINIAGLTLASNQSLDIDGGDGTDAVDVPDDPVVNGTFATDLSGWTVVGNVDRSTSDPSPGGAATFSFGDSPPNGILSQVVNVTAGVQRRLSFDSLILGNGGSVALRAEVLDSNGTTVLATTDVTKNVNDPSTTHTLNFTPTGSTATLRFTDITVGAGIAADFHLDNIFLLSGATLSGSGTVNVLAEAVDVSAAITTAGGNVAISVTDAATLSGAVATGGGAVSITAGDVLLSGTIDAGAGVVTFRPSQLDADVYLGSRPPAFAATIQLSSLDGSSGFRLDGVAQDDRSALAVKSAGDVNGDGINDLLIGAYGMDHNGSKSGSTYVVFGKNTEVDGTFAATLNLSSLDGSDGFRLDGGATEDYSGIAVSSAGDINGDGIDDLLIGAFRADNDAFKSGTSYVVFGKNTAVDGEFAATLNLSSLSGSNGFRLDGVGVLDMSGHAVSAAGDVNGDGIDDLLIGAYGTDLDNLKGSSGSTYVVFGKNTAVDGEFVPAFDLSSLDGSTGFRLDGDAFDIRSGSAVSSAGDVNGDGISDLLIGAYKASNLAGFTYVVFGKDTAMAGNFASTILLSSVNGSDGFRLDGEVSFDQSGREVSSAGDINDDGIDDLLIGARFADPNGSSSGSTYVVFGKNTALDGSFAATIPLSSLDGNSGFRLDGVAAGDQSGSAVSSAGDVNGDGIDDLVIGALRTAPNGTDSGSTYVVFGKNTAVDGSFAATIPLSSLDGNSGFRLEGVAADDRSGTAVSNAGDVNGDGIDDLLIGADGPDHNGSKSGSTYVVFGK